MKVVSLRLAGIRCFEDTGDVRLSPTCTVFVGQNNAGKSTLLKGLLTFQGFPFDMDDVRPEAQNSFYEIVATDVMDRSRLRMRPGGEWVSFQGFRILAGPGPVPHPGIMPIQIGDENGLFIATRPSHYIVPFVAKRKAPAFEQGVQIGAQNIINGTYSNLYSRIDLLATAGHPRHQAFQTAVNAIVGVPITTKASVNGKQAGFYLDEDNFIPLDRMGDGVSEMVALIVELCLEKNKLFVLEEPETNLHPKGLKALLAMIRDSWDSNQFVVATHSNIVVRELGFDDRTKVYRVHRHADDHLTPSVVDEVPREPAAHAALLRDLGYEFGDLGLHEAWLFLEESSAEEVIREILLPSFAPELKGRLRTFSASGASKLEPSVSEFKRLVTFVHLQPVYQGKTWVRADGDEPGIDVVTKLKATFPTFTDETCACFTAAAFETYYPAQFQGQAEAALQVSDKQLRRKAKAELLKDVIAWSKQNPEEALLAWEVSAAEPIALLRTISARIDVT